MLIVSISGGADIFTSSHLRSEENDQKKAHKQMATEDVAEIVKIAVKYSSYPKPKKRPSIFLISRFELQQILCQGKPCAAIAYFDHKTQKIYIDQRLHYKTNKVAKSFIIHEIIHYFQLLAGKMKDGDLNCLKRRALEQEAYVIQNSYLRKNGLQFQTIDIRILRHMCRNTNSRFKSKSIN